MSSANNIKLAAKLENLPKFIEFVSSSAKNHGFDDARIKDIELAIEEVVTNIFNYAYPDRIEDIEIICQSDKTKHFIIKIFDTGLPFDINSVDEPDAVTDFSEIKVGGLGIFFVRCLMNEVQYRRECNKNILILIP
ncbi:serine/threonine-protein kinase RsbW [Candidatus Magnetomoraceae bacterium gMMP-15]